MFACTNCSNVEPITTTVKLFEIRKDKEASRRLEDYELQFYLNDPTLQELLIIIVKIQIVLLI